MLRYVFGPRVAVENLTCNNGRMVIVRILIILVVIVWGGAGPEEHRPLVAAVMGYHSDAPLAVIPVGCPGGGECRGFGYLGDGVVKVDCPDCDLWKEAATPEAVAPFRAPSKNQRRCRRRG